MQQWEYKVVSIEREFYSSKPDKEIEKILNAMGREGWELVGYVSFQNYILAFKRLVPSINNTTPFK